MKKWGILCMVMAVMGLPGVCQSAERAKEPETSATLREVVVTGTRFEQAVEKVPAHVAVITADQIEASGAQSVPDVLRGLGGVLVRDLNGNGNNQVVDMGGFGESADRHVAVVINGRRVNPIDQSGVRWTTIPVENIERIEVLHGSGSVLYGDNAMGGVINIITKDWDRQKHVRAELAAGNLDTRKGNVSVDFGGQDVGVHLGMTEYEAEGYRERSEADRRHFYGKIRCDTADALSFFFETNVSQTGYQLPGALTEAQRDEDRRQSLYPDDQGKDEDKSAVFGMESDWGEKGLWNLTMSYRNEDRDSDMASWWSYMKIESETGGLSSQYILESPLMEHANRLTLGMDFYRTIYDAYGGAFKGARSSFFNHRKRSLSGYIQNEFHILDPLLLNVGVRYEDPKIDLRSDMTVTGESREQFHEGEWAWNLGLAYAFKPKSKVYARVYRSYRYPAVDEYTNLFTGEMNASLTQETALGYEAGIRLSLFEKLALNLRAYLLDVDDEIAWNLAANQNENLDETRHLGGEMDFRYRLAKPVTLYGGAGYANAEFANGENEGKKIPLVPDWKANLGLDVKADFGLRGRLQVNYVGERFFGDDSGNSRKKMEDYRTVDLYLTYRFKIAEFFLNATNILNEKYSDYGWYGSWDQTYYHYPMPEAVYFGGVRLAF